MPNRKGLTVAENVVAIVLTGLIIGATVFSFTASKIWIDIAKHHYRAINLAREETEFLIQKGIQTGEIPPVSETIPIETSYILDGTRSVSYVFDNTNPIDVTVTVTVSVAWTERMWSGAAGSMSETVVVILPATP